MEGKKKKVFISHSSLDKDRIDVLANSLKILGCDTFYSSDITTNKIKYGTVDGGIYGQIKKEIDKSDVILFMVSENFYSSIASVIEVGISYALEKEMIPVSFISGNYKEDLKSIFNHTQLLACLDNENDVMRLLTQLSENAKTMDIFECQKKIVESIKEQNKYDDIEVAFNDSQAKYMGNCNEIALDCETDSKEITEMASKFKNLSNFDYLFIKYICEDRVNEFNFDENYHHWSSSFKEWTEREQICISSHEIYNEKFIRLLERHNLVEKLPGIYYIKPIGIDILEFIYDRDKNKIMDIFNTEYYRF